MVILGGMLVLSGLAVLGTNPSSPTGGAFAAVLGPFGGAVPVLALGLLAFSWLGVMVFKQDGSVERIRFLADRGISPSVAYAARQALPLAVVATSLFLYGSWLWAREFRYGETTQMPSLLAMTLFSLVIFGVSQWISQLIRTLILSIILAPLLSILSVAWLIFGYTMIGFPIWGIALVSLFPFVATALLMRRYMDATDRPLSIWLASVVIATMISLPVGHAMYRVFSTPGMSDSQRTALLAQGEEALRDASAIQLTFSWTAPDTFGPDGKFRTPVGQLVQALEGYAEEPSDWLTEFETLRADPSLGAMCDPYFAEQWQVRTTAAKLNWLNAEEAEASDAFEAFAKWVEASSVLLPAFRQSRRLIDQGNADRMESMLVELLTSEPLQSKLDDDRIRAAIDSLGTPDSRADARRRAVLASWHGVVTKRRLNWLALPVLNTVPQGLTKWLKPRYDESFVLAALEGIDACRESGADDGWRRELHALQQPEGVFEWSRYGDSMRSLPTSITQMRYGMKEYGELWGREWEYRSLEGSK